MENSFAAYTPKNASTYAKDNIREHGMQGFGAIVQSTTCSCLLWADNSDFGMLRELNRDLAGVGRAILLLNLYLEHSCKEHGVGKGSSRGAVAAGVWIQTAVLYRD
jgi:hypothetical protein